MLPKQLGTGLITDTHRVCVKYRCNATLLLYCGLHYENENRHSYNDEIRVLISNTAAYTLCYLRWPVLSQRIPLLYGFTTKILASGFVMAAWESTCTVSVIYYQRDCMA